MNLSTAYLRGYQVGQKTDRLGIAWAVIVPAAISAVSSISSSISASKKAKAAKAAQEAAIAAQQAKTKRLYIAGGIALASVALILVLQKKKKKA